MSWRTPRFGIRHSLRDAGVASVSYANALASGDFKTFWLDERREPGAFASAAADHYIQVDLGTGYASVTVDRMLIPVGHNFDTYDLRVREDSAADMSVDPQVLYSVTPHSGTGQIDVTLTESADRYIRVDWITDNFAPTTPELWLTKTLAPTQGPDPLTWRDDYLYNVLSFVTPAGDRGDLELGSKQRIFEFDYPKIDSAADIAILDQLVEDVGVTKAFIFDPPFDDEDALICKMRMPPRRIFDHPVPAGGNKAYSYHFELIEQIV